MTSTCRPLFKQPSVPEYIEATMTISTCFERRGYHERGHPMIEAKCVIRENRGDIKSLYLVRKAWASAVSFGYCKTCLISEQNS
jgi:hypothetical protein